MGGPYRDENESLRAEVERLRAELAKRRVAHGRLAILLVLLDLGALLVLRPWLNGPSDEKFWAALAILAGIAVAAGASAIGFRSKA
jgi:tRNA nucleotidyltransferase/poly(A) polymerase